MPLLVAISFLVALCAGALIAAVASLDPQRLFETVALAGSAAVTVLCVVLVVRSSGGWLVYWWSGIRPHGGVALGVGFTVDPIGAGLGALAGLLVLLGLAYGHHAFDRVGQPLFQALMLVLLAAMVGFALTGDLFSMLVMMELATVPAIALTLYLSDEPGPLQGGMNFAVTNTLAAFLVLLGIALVYARTGALNLAQIGETLAGRPPDGLVAASFALIAGGLFVKAAIVPMHFWLSDAYAVAPASVCAVFSGALSELGLYGVARLYWTSYAGALAPHEESLRAILVGGGALTAVVGAVMCLQQTNVKRLLAFATVAHAGMFLVGIGLLTAEGLSGAAIWVAADGMAKAALFMAAGVLLRHTGESDERRLRGRGRELPLTGAAVLVGGLALATLPPFGTFLGKALVEGSSEDVGMGWVPWLLLVASALVGGAVLRVFGRAFLGLGEDDPDDDADDSEEESGEPGHEPGRPPGFMLVPPLVLLGGSLALGVAPHLASHVQRAAERFVDRQAYASAVLHAHVTPLPPLEPVAATGKDYVLSLLAVAAAVAVAAAGLRTSSPALAAARSSGARALAPLRALHSGHPGDYVAWMTAGVSLLGGLLAVAVR